MEALTTPGGARDWTFDPAQLAPPRAECMPLPGGGCVLRSPDPLQPHARCIGDWIERWSHETPDAPALAERDGAGGWRRLTWRELRQQVGRIAQGLLDLQLPAGAPVVVLSDNAIDHQLLLLAGMHVGRPVCSVSSAYCRLAKEYSKVHAILAVLRPALVYASDAQVYGAALAGCTLATVKVLGHGADAVPGAMPFDTLLSTAEGTGVMQAFAAITPETHAKYLLTSGSTGQPKVVVNTHRMLCANQQMVAQVWRFLDHETPHIVDWLPWSHTFGGNYTSNLVLRNGGSMVIDAGRPAPGLIQTSVANLAEMQPTLWFNVPAGFAMALPLLEADDALARRVFERLRMMFYAGAALPQATWDRMQALARRVRGSEVWLTTAWGATETSPAVTAAHWRLDRAGVIGGVLPGLELKLVPNGDKLEMRVRGPSVFPGYRDNADLTAAAFDDDGYYRIGDAGHLADADRPEAGVVFDGRVAEDFKLATGTWVSAGMLRVTVVSALAPLAQDVVVTGHDRDQVGVLVFPSASAAALPPDDCAAQIAAALAALKAAGGGSSQAPVRALLLAEPPNADAGEITDKGYVNQRAVLTRRAADVQRLYAGGAGVIVVADPAR